MKELMDSIGTPSPCLPIACPKNTDGLACNPDQLKNCKAIAGNFIWNIRQLNTDMPLMILSYRILP
jgi:hypothetical protein